MAVSALIKRIFETDASSAEAVVVASRLRAIEAAEQVDRDDAQRLIDWYMRKRTEIVEHLKERAKRTFDSTDDWQFPVRNSVPRVIRKLAQAYAQPVKRVYTRDGKPLDKTDPELAKIELMYAKIDRTEKMRALDRWSTLLNTTHAEVVFRNGAIDWDIRLRPIVTIVPDPEDFLEFSQFAYSWEPEDPDTREPRPGLVIWTQEEHVFVTKGGVRAGITRPDGKNPYKYPDGRPMIPVVTIRRNTDIDDYWGVFGADIVDAVEAANVQLGNLWETMALQIHGQPIFINVDTPDGSTVKLGPKHPLVAKKVMKDDVAPDIKFPKPEPSLEATRAILDWFGSETNLDYGLNPGADAQEQRPESGLAKIVANLELLEEREQALARWEAYEVDADLKSRAVWNLNRPDQTIADDIELVVEYQKPKILETPVEKETRWTLQIQGGRRSLVDYFMEEDGLEEDEARAKAARIKKDQEQIAPKPTARLPEQGAQGAEDGGEDDET